VSFTAVMTAAGLAVAVLVGSVLTAQAVVAGNLPATFVRFVLATLAGGYYLYLHLLVRGKITTSQ